MRSQRLLLLASLVASWPALTGFVLLSATKATLPVTPDNPQLTFTWDGKAPAIKDKEKYAAGAYSGLSDEEFMQQLLKDSLAVWNGVKGAYVTLAVTPGTGEVVRDAKDKKFVIVTEKSSNLSQAAFANPQVDDADKTVIADCDISIADTSTAAKELAYTIVHELGHCLGLGHSHTNYNAIMGYSRMERDIRLGADDMAGVIYLYPEPGYVDEKPTESVCGVAGGARGRGILGAVALLAAPVAVAMMPGRRRRATDGVLTRLALPRRRGRCNKFSPV